MNDKIAMANDKLKRKYDLEERTTKFGENIIKFAKKIPENSVTRPLIPQLVKAGTSIGANYCEADDAESRIVHSSRKNMVKQVNKLDH